jgi:hypothetical protein
VTTYLVDVHHHLHTCPADPVEPHPFDSTQTIIAITPGGPCRTPVTIRSGNTTATIDCRLNHPAERQCGACRNTVWVHQTTITDHGYQGPADHPNYLHHLASLSGASA